jgi:epsilon-lactone hydrolase
LEQIVFVLKKYSSCLGHSGFECHLSRLLNITVVHLEYRLAPEHTITAAIDDAISFYDALIQKGVSSRLIVMGDSAGGGLALLTIQNILTRHSLVPRAVIIMSPWTDFSLSGASYMRNRFTDFMIPADSAEWGVQQILGPNHSFINRRDPLYSPLFGPFKGFPPMFITVGTAEVLEDDAKNVAQKARYEGVDVTLHEGRHLMHVYPLFFGYFPEARETLEKIRRWLEVTLQRNGINNP